MDSCANDGTRFASTLVRVPDVCASALYSFLRVQLTELLRARYKGFVLTIWGVLCPLHDRSFARRKLPLPELLSAIREPIITTPFAFRKMFARSRVGADTDESLSRSDSWDLGTNCHRLADNYYAFPSTRESRVGSK